MQTQYDECLAILDLARSAFPSEATHDRVVKLVAIRNDIRQVGSDAAKKADCIQRIKDLHDELVEQEYPRIAEHYQFKSIDDLAQAYREPMGILELELKLRGRGSRVMYRAKTARKHVH